MNTTDWLNALKVGDRVVTDHRTCADAVVSRITATQVLTKHSHAGYSTEGVLGTYERRWNKRNGREYGTSSTWGRSYLSPYSLEYVERKVHVGLRNETQRLMDALTPKALDLLTNEQVSTLRAALVATLKQVKKS